MAVIENSASVKRNSSADPVALVTGGANGIGLATARVLASHGYSVAILDIEPDAAQQCVAALGDRHLAIQCDVSSEADVVRAMAKIRETYGRLDAVVNNAGVGSPHLPTLDQTLGSFERVVQIHLFGTFLVSREAVRLMQEQGAGSIVNISSIAGVLGLPKRNAYGAAKAGIIAMTRSMACEFASIGIRVNAVTPGFVATELVKKLESEGFIDMQKLASRVPMGRLGRPEEIAACVDFLCSPAASYVNGAILGVDGGWAAFGDAGTASDPRF